MDGRPSSVAVLASLEAGAESAAQALLGALLVHETPEGRCVGRIIETEAYLGQGDPASHSACGRTARNASMFELAGTVYVYRSYGVHLCLNVVTGAAGVGEAVLLRALEPLEGLERMHARRNVQVAGKLCDGPGKLTQAFAVPLALDGTTFGAGDLAILQDERPRPAQRVLRGPRIGISKGAELSLRFRLE